MPLAPSEKLAPPAALLATTRFCIVPDVGAVSVTLRIAGGDAERAGGDDADAGAGHDAAAAARTKREIAGDGVGAGAKSGAAGQAESVR